MKVRFLLDKSEALLVDGEPANSREISRAQLDACMAAGVPLELIDEDQPSAAPPGKKRHR